jgi:hypothetical protein
MMELNELNVKNKHKIKGEASSSTLVEDLASHAKERHKKFFPAQKTRKLRREIVVQIST